MNKLGVALMAILVLAVVSTPVAYIHAQEVEGIDILLENMAQGLQRAIALLSSRGDVPEEAITALKDAYHNITTMLEKVKEGNTTVIHELNITIIHVAKGVGMTVKTVSKNMSKVITVKVPSEENALRLKDACEEIQKVIKSIPENSVKHKLEEELEEAKELIREAIEKGDEGKIIEAKRLIAEIQQELRLYPMPKVERALAMLVEGKVKPLPMPVNLTEMVPELKQEIRAIKNMTMASEKEEMIKHMMISIAKVMEKEKEKTERAMEQVHEQVKESVKMHGNETSQAVEQGIERLKERLRELYNRLNETRNEHLAHRVAQILNQVERLLEKAEKLPNPETYLSQAESLIDEVERMLSSNP